MALLKQGPLGVVSGSLGGICVATTKAGAVIRARKPQQTNNSPSQLAAKQSLDFWSKLWQSPALDDIRPAWDQYARSHPVPNRFGIPRLRSGYCTWLSFLPLHKTFYPAALLLMPPTAANSDQILSFTATLSAAPSFITTTSGSFDYPNVYEQVQIARFQNPRNHITRPIWQNMPYPTVLKSFDSMDWFLNPLKPPPPEPGETWQVRIRWWNKTQEPLPWFYTHATAPL
jgi:hypothetical protein